MNVFDAKGFLPRGHCGIWSNDLKYLYIGSNFIIFIAYLSIPFSLAFLWKRKRNDITNAYMLLAFCIFILSCGMTHLCDVLAFIWPAYRFFTLIDTITAISSLVTACMLPFVVRNIISLPTIIDYRQLNDELEARNKAKRAKIAEDTQTIYELRNQLEHLERLKANGVWYAKQFDTIKDLRKLIKEKESNYDD